MSRDGYLLWLSQLPWNRPAFRASDAKMKIGGGDSWLWAGRGWLKACDNATTVPNNWPKAVIHTPNRNKCLLERELGRARPR